MKLAIYDFDGTYVSVQTVPFLFKLFKEMTIDEPLRKKIWKKMSFWYILHKLKLRWDKETFRKNAMALTIDLLHGISDDKRQVFLEAFYQHLIPKINQDLKKQLKQDIKDGYHTILLSGSFDIMIEPFLKEGFHHVIGTPSKDKDRLLTSKEVKILISNEKVEAIKKHFPEADYALSKAYADSYYDLPLLRMVGEPYVYQGDERLLSYAKLHQLNIYPSSKKTSPEK